MGLVQERQRALGLVDPGALPIAILAFVLSSSRHLLPPLRSLGYWP
jgi:hypothetical protein